MVASSWTDADVASVIEVSKEAKIVITHMDTVAHASIPRADMRQRLRSRSLIERVVMPEDGTTLSF